MEQVPRCRFCAYDITGFQVLLEICYPSTGIFRLAQMPQPTRAAADSKDVVVDDFTVGQPRSGPSTWRLLGPCARVNLVQFQAIRCERNAK